MTRSFFVRASLAATVAFLAASAACIYHPAILNVPNRWLSTGLVLRTEASGPPVDRLRVLWTGRMAVATEVPPGTVDKPAGSWVDAISGEGSFTGLAAGATADLHRDQGTASLLRPGLWDLSFSLWEDGCPVLVTCRQRVFGGRLTGFVGGAPVTEEGLSTADLVVRHDGCISPDGLESTSVNAAPVTDGTATAPIDDYRVGTPPCRWAERWGAANEWTVVAGGAPGKKALTVTSTATTGPRLLAWDYVPPAGDAEILAKVRPGSDLGATGGCVRAGGAAGTENAYCAGLFNGANLRVGRFVAGVWGYLDPPAAFTYGTGLYWIRFRVEGSTFRAKAWADDPLDPYLANEPPGWMIPSGVLPAPALGPGAVGVAVENPSTGPRYEWFSVGLAGASAPKPAAPPSQAPRPAPPRSDRRTTAAPAQRSAGSR